MTATEYRTRIAYRSSITGRFVSREYAEENPDTTERQTIRVPVRQASE